MFGRTNKAADGASRRYMFTTVENISGDIYVRKYFFFFFSFPEIIWEGVIVIEAYDTNVEIKIK